MLTITEAKYSKVKRYYFEKDAQVQHLQNTVAHQRMAVSRTILDDSEYQNRFGRLDGAIKDLAFSVRKDWKGLPKWLEGMVTEGALKVGMKEMTAVGRAVISRWLVEEVFQRHFHPGLDPAFSVQLKTVEMNLRRQRPSSDEDRENASARLSYWRRTTLDGLGDSIIGPAADEHRAELVEHLIMELATFMGTQLHDNAQPGLEAGVRMIIENSINIIEKVPLEARDVCVDYFPPGRRPTTSAQQSSPSSDRFRAGRRARRRRCLTWINGGTIRECLASTKATQEVNVRHIDGPQAHAQRYGPSSGCVRTRGEERASRASTQQPKNPLRSIPSCGSPRQGPCNGIGQGACVASGVEHLIYIIVGN
jgi:hypothetical protein